MIMKKEVFEIIEIKNGKGIIKKQFDYVVVVAIIISILVSIIETFNISKELNIYLYIIQAITIAFFTVEYILRIWTAKYLYPELGEAKARFKYIFSFWGIIDFLAFFPFYIPLDLFPNGIMALRLLRVMKILRLFRINRYYDGLNVITAVLKEKKNQLISSVFVIFVLMLAASMFMYELEHSAQPEAFNNAFSGFWWASSALLTVGYGDIYPITTAGKIVGIIIEALGVGLVAIPTGIISAGFIENLNKSKKAKYCPHCGEKL